jgi:hypothetical protein
MHTFAGAAAEFLDWYVRGEARCALIAAAGGRCVPLLSSRMGSPGFWWRAAG